MKKIENLGTIGGRELLRQIYRELRYDKQRSSFASLLVTWRIATSEIELGKYVQQDVTILHSLGFFKGTSLWLEEVVNRFYFSTINSFVYFGAAILLVIIGARRFSENVTDETVVWGIIFEAAMLMFMFFVMLFTPSDDLSEEDDNESNEHQAELMTEVGEISRDFAAATVQLEQITEKLAVLIDKQSTAIDLIAETARNTMNLAMPNPDMIKTMAETNQILSDFKDKISELVSSVDDIKSEEIRNSVRREIELLIVDRLKAK